MYRSVIALAVALTALVLAGPASSAFAVHGQLRPVTGGECVRNATSSQTTGEPATCPTSVPGLDGPFDIAFSPDGDFAYATSYDGDSLAVMTRNPVNGKLAPLPGNLGCVADVNAPSTTACSTTAIGLNGPVSLVLSPDGHFLYVSSLDADTVSVFARDATTGLLSQLPGDDACITDATAPATTPCTQRAIGMHGARAIRMSPDGSDVYVVATGAKAIAAFSRDPGTGALSQLPGDDACIEDVISPAETGCPRIGIGLDGPRALAISPDGKNVYSAGVLGDTIASYARNPVTGGLTQLPGTAACAEGPSSPSTTTCPTVAKGLDAAFGVTVSPDGANVYVAATNSDDVAAFSRNAATGALTQLAGSDACIRDPTAPTPPGCPVTGLGLDGADGVAVDPSGETVYVASIYGDSIAAFSRSASTGALTQLSGGAACLEDATAPSSTTCPTVANGLNGARVPELSADGRFLYQPSSIGDAAAVFARDTSTDPPPPPPPPPNAGYSATVAADAPVGYWRLGESSGKVAADASGGGHPGTYGGGYTLGRAGVVTGNTAVQLSVNGNVLVPSGGALNTADTCSLEAWVMSATVGKVQSILVKGVSYQVYLDGNNRLVLRKPNVDVIVMATRAVPRDGRFHHVVATKSGTTVALYLDGLAVTGAVKKLALASTTNALQIGSGVGYLTGTIDEVAVYDKALTAARVAAHYAAAG